MPSKPSKPNEAHCTRNTSLFAGRKFFAVGLSVFGGGWHGCIEEGSL